MRRTLTILSLTFALAAMPGCFGSDTPEKVMQPADEFSADSTVSDTSDSEPAEVAQMKAEPPPPSADADKGDASAYDAPATAASSSKRGKKAGVSDALSPRGIARGDSAPRVRTQSLNSELRSGGGGARVSSAGSGSSVGIGRVGTVSRRSSSRSHNKAMSDVKGVRVPGASSSGVASLDAAPPRAHSESKRDAARRKVATKDRRVAQPTPAPEPIYAELDEGGSFQHAGTNPFTETREDKLSTFAIDVDTASYTYARRFLRNGSRPGASSVRVEEWVNAFHYEYKNPTGHPPFNIAMEAGPSPLDEGRHILRVGIQGKKVSAKDRKPVHLTFLVDTSGSMSRHDKLPLAQKALHHLVDNLSSKDSVALITYAGSTSEVLTQTSARHKDRIHRAIDALRSGGGTAMGSGMEMAYRNAGKFVAPGSVSRVIVLSDGDANIGRTRHQDILKSIKGYVSEGITMSTVGFGTGNYRDHLMEQLADAGDGNYSYIDSFAAAQKVFGTDLSGTLQVIAKDVKIQVEMNPKVVKRYRLLGYENREVADRDFRNDKVDAGEIGAGHSVTALYEVELVDPYASVRDDVATVRVRYKQPRGTRATEVAETFTQNHVRTRFGDLERDTRWAAAVSLAAEVLRGSPYARDKSLEDAWALAAEASGGKYAKERRELVDLLDRTHRREALAAR
jgi:Ca-activated chloride channel family protein